MCRKLNTNYPSVTSIINEAQSIYKLLKPREVKNMQGKASEAGPSTVSSTNIKKKHEIANRSERGRNGPKDEREKNLSCKFCAANNHSSLRCLKFKTHKDRLFQVRKLNLCEFCLSSKHVTSDCVGLKTGLPFKCLGCGSSKHVFPMCTSPSVSMSVEKTRGFDSGKM